MFPIRDDQPRFSTPYVNYFIIALNIAVYVFFELPAQFQGARQFDVLVLQFPAGGYTGASPALIGQRAYYGTFNNDVVSADLTRKRIVLPASEATSV